MKLFSTKSIIFYSILGAITAFIIAPFIRSLIDFSTGIELLITTAIIVPMILFSYGGTSLLCASIAFSVSALIISEFRDYNRLGV